MNIIIPKAINLVNSNVPESTYSEWDNAGSYLIGDTVYLTLESDGITERTPHKKYEAITDNTGKYPADNPTDWLDLGATNKWAMFDRFISSKTSQTNAINVTLSAQKIDSVCLFDLVAEKVQIIIKTSDLTVLSDETINLKDEVTASWSEYFFSEIVYRDLLIHDVSALYLNLLIDIIITPLDDEAACGHCVVGLKKDLGLTRLGVSAGISDYSRKTTNDFGETEFIQRAFAKTIDIDLYIKHNSDAKQFDRAHKILSSVRATPIVFNANNSSTTRDSFVTYGYYKHFDLIAKYQDSSHCSLTIEGLI
jgi:hypothetical protein